MCNDTIKALEQTLHSYGERLRAYRLTRRQPIFHLADELDVPLNILNQIETQEPISGSLSELKIWRDRIQKALGAANAPNAFVPPFLRG